MSTVYELCDRCGRSAPAEGDRSGDGFELCDDCLDALAGAAGPNGGAWPPGWEAPAGATATALAVPRDRTRGRPRQKRRAPAPAALADTWGFRQKPGRGTDLGAVKAPSCLGDVTTLTVQR
jgi:hypothetical protein